MATIFFSWAPVPDVPAFVFWSAISLISSLAIIRLPVGSGVLTSLGEIVDLAAFATVGPYPVLVSNIGGVIGRAIILGRSDPVRNIYNLSQWNIACLIAYFVFNAIQSTSVVTFSWISFRAILCAWFVYSIISTGLVSLAIACSNNSSFKSVWSHNYSKEFLVSLASVPLALVMAILYTEYGTFSVLLLAAPLIGLITLVGLWMERTRWQARVERESQLAEMGKATASLLHELSRPLSRIIMTSDFAIDGGVSKKKALETILSEARDAHYLSEKLVGVMKVKINRTEVTISELVRKLKNELEAEQIPLGVRGLDEFADIIGYWDKDLILTALQNLVKNAWESQSLQGPSPELIINCNSIFSESTSYQHNKICRFLVADRGPGLPNGLDSDIFEALYSTKESGFGIGLFLANQIALAHGGKLEASNAQITGAIFALELPLADRRKERSARYREK